MPTRTCSSRAAPPSFSIRPALHSLAIRNAVLALAPRHPFAKVLINTGRLSVAPNLRGSSLLTPDAESWNTSITPGNAAVDAPVEAGIAGRDWLVHYLDGAFQLMIYAQARAELDLDTIAALDGTRLRSGSGASRSSCLVKPGQRSTRSPPCMIAEA